MGLETPSQSLAYAHIALVALLTVLVLWRPRAWIRLAVLGVGYLITLSLPVLWVGPVWTEPPELRRFAWSFFLAFASSLGIPYSLGAVAVTILARRPEVPALRARIAWPLAAYLVGLLLSLPVSFNHALAYPFIR